MRPSLPDFDSATQLRIAAHRAAVCGTIGRWLMHELRGPVQVLTLAPELLDASGGTADDATRTMLAEGTAALERVASVLDDLLQRPPAAPILEPLSAGPLVERTAAFARAHRGDLAVECTIADDLPAVAVVEGWALPVLAALMVNAAEALAQTGGTVHLAATAAPDGVLVDIRDDGPGFDAVIAAAPFEGRSTRPPAGWPRGLGLPVGRLLLRAMGGDLTVERSAPGDVCVRARFAAWR